MAKGRNRVKPILPARRRCQDCGELVVVDDYDEVAICGPCTVARRDAEASTRAGDGQAGARWIGHQREAAMRPSPGEGFAERIGALIASGKRHT